jgi:hypothetical protein
MQDPRREAGFCRPSLGMGRTAKGLPSPAVKVSAPRMGVTLQVVEVLCGQRIAAIKRGLGGRIFQQPVKGILI